MTQRISLISRCLIFFQWKLLIAKEVKLEEAIHSEKLLEMVPDHDHLWTRC